MAKTRAEKLKAVHETALKEFNDIHSAVRDEREQCLQDRRFCSIAGAQWEGKLGDQFENKPKFEVNKIHLSVIRIINEFRKNRVTVDFVNRDGLEKDDLASVCDGLYRACEESSGAEEAYNNAFEEAATGGFGAFRYRAEYQDDSDPENDNQHILIEPIYDADSTVFFDAAAKRQDKADAKHCFVLSSMSKASFEEVYEQSVNSWDKQISESEYDWATNDLVYLAEYYVIEQVKENLHVWEKLDGTELRLSDDELEAQEQTLKTIGAKELRIRKIKTKKVRKYIMCGDCVLEDCGYIAGPNIPVIPVYGKRWYVDGVERCMGHVRLAKDAQRLKNMQLSKLGEISALSTTEKPIVTPEQISGHERAWARDNIDNAPFLTVNPITDANGNEQALPPLAYTKVPNIPPAMAALLQITEEDIQDILGNASAGEKMIGNVSTETAHLIQNQLDMQTFIYMSNFSLSLKRAGEVWLGMAKEVYVEEGRKMKSVGKQGDVSQIELMRPVYDDKNRVVYENDLTKASFDVVVDVGPSSSTQKASTVRTLSTMAGLSEDPETRQVLSSMAIMNMDGEGVADLRQYFRAKLIKMGVIQPSEAELEKLQQEQQNAQPSTQDQYFLAEAEKARAEAVESQADTILKQAKADETRAKTAETLTNIKQDSARLALETVKTLGERVTPPPVTGSIVEE